MYFLIKWLIGRLKRRSAAAAKEPGPVDGPDQPMVRSPGDHLMSPNRRVAPSAGHDGAALSVRSREGQGRPGRAVQSRGHLITPASVSRSG